MRDIIIPIDFSETSLNAARYAAAMLSSKENTRVILYTMFKSEEDSETSDHYLQSLKAELEEKGVSNIETVKELGSDLIDNLARLAYQKTAELIIMGITEKEEWRQFFVGSNTVKMVEQNICPVMIIPQNAKFNGITNVSLASDFKDVDATTPMLAIKTILDIFNANLHIVNVDNEHYVSLTDEYLAERAKMQKLFSEFNPEFYFIGVKEIEEELGIIIIFFPADGFKVNDVFKKPVLGF